MQFSEEYSEKVDELRKNRVKVSYHKYGPAKQNFSSGNVQAIPTMERCVQKYKDTKNTEYLLDAMNYLCLNSCGHSCPVHFSGQRIARTVRVLLA